MEFEAILDNFKKILDGKEKSIENIQRLSSIFNKINKNEIKYKKKIKISIISDFNTSYLKEILPLFLINKSISAEIIEADFGTLGFKIRNPNDNFWQNQSDVLICIPSHRELSFNFNIKIF